jgi:hypothetical protein
VSNHFDDNGEVQAQGFGVTTLATRATETAAMAVAEQAKAAVTARYIMALQRPRDMDNVRTKILKECRRPGFAAVAKYAVPRGGKRVIGPSIRFAEAAVRCMTNILPEKMVVFDDADRRIVRVTVTDLESNVTYSEDVVISKTVERSFVKDGMEVLSVRENSSGNKTYLVRAGDDDLRNKEAATVSKAIRGMALRLLPGDILDDAMEMVEATLRDQHAKDPAAETKKIADAFSTINIMPSDLKEFLGCELAQASPADIIELRRVFQAIRDGETTWRDVVASKVVESPTPVATTMKEKLRQKAAKAPEPAAAREPGIDSEGNPV